MSAITFLLYIFYFIFSQKVLFALLPQTTNEKVQKQLKSSQNIFIFFNIKVQKKYYITSLYIALYVQIPAVWFIPTPIYVESRGETLPYNLLTEQCIQLQLT